jgi:hypothetical protein
MPLPPGFLMPLLVIFVGLQLELESRCSAK